MENPSIQNGYMTFYTTLDSVLDTRLGCLRLHYPDRFATQESSMLILQGYGNRKYEKFPGIDTKEFLALYSVRNKDVLKHSAPTLLIDEIVKFAIQIQHDNAQKQGKLIPKLVLNVHPYDITDPKELKELEIALTVMTCNELEIEIVNKHVQELTSEYCGKNFVCMAMYDYTSWFDYNTEAGHFERFKLPEVTLMVPHVWFNDELEEEDFKIKRNGKSVADTLEVMASFYVGMQFIPIHIFSFRGALVSAQIEDMAKELANRLKESQSASVRT